MASARSNSRGAAQSGDWRSRHRSRNHDIVHAEAGHAPAAPPVHPLIPRSEVGLITTNTALADLVRGLRAAGSFAYDTEFIAENSYFPKLCLIQVATKDLLAQVDPLARINLTPFWELICDPAVEKIAHAARQDLEPVIRILGREPANVFDTQIAAGFAGMTYPVSLSRMVDELVGVQLDKGSSMTLWDQRPLSAMQLRYAADDVRYLPAARHALEQRLADAGNTAWALQECETLCRRELHTYDAQAAFERIRGSGALSRRAQAVLRALVAWRDAAARAEDVPPRTLVRDEVLVDLARHPAASQDQLASLRGMPRPVVHAHGDGMIGAMRDGLAAPVSTLRSVFHVKETPSEQFGSDSLWAFAQCLAFAQSIAPGLAATHQDLDDLHRSITQGLPLDGLRVLTGWRRAAVGDPLLSLVQAGTEVGLEWVDGCLRARTIVCPQQADMVP